MSLPQDFVVTFDDDGEEKEFDDADDDTHVDVEEKLFGRLCDEIADDQFWTKAGGLTREEIRAIYRSRPQRIRRRRKKLKIDESDPRPHFIDEVAEAYNTGDILKVREVFERHYESDCVFIQRYTQGTPDVPPHREFHSREQMLQYLGLYLEACPDGVLLVTSRKLHIRQDGTSYLVANLNFDAIWLFNVLLRNVVTTTKNLLARFNPLSAVYNYFITAVDGNSAANPLGEVMEPEDGGGLVDCESRDADDPSRGLKIRKVNGSMHTSDQIEHDVRGTVLGENVDQTQLETASHMSLPSVGAKAEYPGSWFTQDNIFATTQSALLSWNSAWAGSSSSSVQSSSSNEISGTQIDDKSPAAFTSPVEVVIPETTFSMQPKKQPHRVNVAVAYVAHINENFKIYKTESFVRGKFSLDWWGNYASKPDDDDVFPLPSLAAEQPVNHIGPSG